MVAAAAVGNGGERGGEGDNGGVRMDINQRKAPDDKQKSHLSTVYCYRCVLCRPMPLILLLLLLSMMEDGVVGGSP